ncbi:hypothetical protein CAEBREN_21052 [Caenorhabditis brenneri]|uniref:Uncharacterized protein n=1 Tax=Caenorhabditis brenneri TaxID=135651 RepID=G0P590_CAEBE|nr:hypothetical protein CAEBREN_21052 [Caenorhabditis brenneri]
MGEIRNLETETVVSSVIVSPVYNEFYHTGNREFCGKIAMDCAERGSVIMFVNNGLYLKRETRKVDYKRTNEEYTYITKNLGNTRFNA